LGDLSIYNYCNKNENSSEYLGRKYEKPNIPGIEFFFTGSENFKIA